MHQTPIAIPLSKKKIILSIIMSLVFELLALWMLATAGDQTRIPPIMLIGICLFSMAFFGMVLFTAVKKLRDPKPGLLIDNEGITDNSAFVSVGLIRWTDILGVSTTQVSTSKFLLIYVDKPEQYIALARNRLAAWLMTVNLRTYGTPIAIAAGTLSCSFDTLEEMINFTNK